MHSGIYLSISLSRDFALVQADSYIVLYMPSK